MPSPSKPTRATAKPATPQVIVQQLAATEPFKEASPSLVRAVAQRLTVHGYSKGDTVVAHGEPSTDLFIILSGEMRVSQLAASGRLLTYQVLPAGEMFGEISATDHQPRSATVVAESDARLARLASADFDHIAGKNAEFAMLIMRRLAFLNRLLSKRLLEHHAYDVKARICSELLRLYAVHGEEAFRITDQDMASRIGTTRENVARTHGQLRRIGLIERKRSTLRVLKADMLKAFIDDTESG